MCGTYYPQCCDIQQGQANPEHIFRLSLCATLWPWCTCFKLQVCVGSLDTTTTGWTDRCLKHESHFADSSYFPKVTLTPELAVLDLTRHQMFQDRSTEPSSVSWFMLALFILAVTHVTIYFIQHWILYKLENLFKMYFRYSEVIFRP